MPRMPLLQKHYSCDSQPTRAKRKRPTRMIALIIYVRIQVIPIILKLGGLKEKKKKRQPFYYRLTIFWVKNLGQGSAGFIFCSIWQLLKSLSGIQWAEGLVRGTRWLHSQVWRPGGMAGRLGTAGLKRFRVTLPAQWSQGCQTFCEGSEFSEGSQSQEV